MIDLIGFYKIYKSGTGNYPLFDWETEDRDNAAEEIELAPVMIGNEEGELAVLPCEFLYRMKVDQAGLDQGDDVYRDFGVLRRLLEKE